MGAIRPLTSVSSLSPSSFFPLMRATFLSTVTARSGRPESTSQRADSANHLRERASASEQPDGGFPGAGEQDQEERLE